MGVCKRCLENTKKDQYTETPRKEDAMRTKGRRMGSHFGKRCRGHGTSLKSCGMENLSIVIMMGAGGECDNVTETSRSVVGGDDSEGEDECEMTIKKRIMMTMTMLMITMIDACPQTYSNKSSSGHIEDDCGRHSQKVDDLRDVEEQEHLREVSKDSRTGKRHASKVAERVTHKAR